MSITFDEAARYVAIATVIGVWAVWQSAPFLFKFTRTTTKSLLSIARKQWQNTKQFAGWAPDKFSVSAAALAGVLILLLIPFSNKPDVPAPQPPDVACEHDYLDDCHDNYRTLLSDLYTEYADKDLTDPDTFDTFDKTREATYKACYED